MIDGKKVLAVVPAKGKSERIENKNLKKISGKPLIDYTIESAKKSNYIDKIIVSTDSKEIMDHVNKFGIESFEEMSPNEKTLEKDELRLKFNDFTTQRPILIIWDIFSSLNGEFDIIVLLQPTSPLRTSEDIDRGIEKYNSGKFDSVFGISETETIPYWTFSENSENFLDPLFDTSYFFKRSQELPKTYVTNGAFFVSNIENLKKKKSFFLGKIGGVKMSKDLSIDIDTKKDLETVEAKINEK